MKIIITENQVDKIKSKIHEYVKKYGFEKSRQIFGDKVLLTIGFNNNLMEFLSFFKNLKKIRRRQDSDKEIYLTKNNEIFMVHDKRYNIVDFNPNLWELFVNYFGDEETIKKTEQWVKQQYGIEDIETFSLDPDYNEEYEDDIRPYINESLLNQDGSLGDLSQSEINEILKGYIECALWTEEERLSDEMVNDEDDEDIDDMDEIEKLIYLQQNFSRKSLDSFFEEDIDGDSRIDAYLDIKKFIKLAGDDAIAEAIDDNGAFQLGMDIWLTRNGHGSGFFDRNYIHEDSLTTAAQQLKSKDLVIGDDGKLYFE
jgi:hypothetical protein